MQRGEAVHQVIKDPRDGLRADVIVPDDRQAPRNQVGLHIPSDRVVDRVEALSGLEGVGQRGRFLGRLGVSIAHNWALSDAASFQAATAPCVVLCHIRCCF